MSHSLTLLIGSRKKTNGVHLSWKIFRVKNGKWSAASCVKVHRILPASCIVMTRVVLRLILTWTEWHAGVLLTHKPGSTARTSSLPLTRSHVNSNADISWASWYCKWGSGAGDQLSSLCLHSWTSLSSNNQGPSWDAPPFPVPCFSPFDQVSQGWRAQSPTSYQLSVVPCLTCQ